ncbi:MAG: heavy metal-binding domain-containing protein, partial [Bacteroidales bacterium]|nr:heavy metal-binding domain-containing protein [Bacteroidales bacterium]
MKANNNSQQYNCPMQCEGDKTYDAPGNCPVCNMKLVEVDDTYANHHEHKKNHKHQPSSKGPYYCPMYCEGDKTYNKPGDCPVCGMHLKKEESAKPSAEVIYTCPMHPEIRQDHPGDCPKCGMTLVPEKGEETSEEEIAYKQMAKKFWIALILSVPVLIIA